MHMPDAQCNAVHVLSPSRVDEQHRQGLQVHGHQRPDGRAPEGQHQAGR